MKYLTYLLVFILSIRIKRLIKNIIYYLIIASFLFFSTRMRIISGLYKNRFIPTVRKASYRPTTERVRESIFSVLNSSKFFNRKILSEDTVALDLFSGTGSLAFEALSRGAGEVTLVDMNYDYLRLAQQFAIELGIKQDVFFLNLNIIFLPKAFKLFNLIFIDPPYTFNLFGKIFILLERKNWLKNGAVLVVELPNKLVLKDFLSNKYSIILEKRFGETKIIFLKYLS